VGILPKNEASGQKRAISEAIATTKARTSTGHDTERRIRLFIKGVAGIEEAMIRV
jgi:hypothetical protein